MTTSAMRYKYKASLKLTDANNHKLHCSKVVDTVLQPAIFSAHYLSIISRIASFHELFHFVSP